MDGLSAAALALRISSNSSTFDLVRMGPRLQPTFERLVDPSLAVSHVGPERMITVGPVQVITPTQVQLLDRSPQPGGSGLGQPVGLHPTAVGDGLLDGRT